MEESGVEGLLGCFVSELVIAVVYKVLYCIRFLRRAYVIDSVSCIWMLFRYFGVIFYKFLHAVQLLSTVSLFMPTIARFF